MPRTRPRNRRSKPSCEIFQQEKWLQNPTIFHSASSPARELAEAFLRQSNLRRVEHLPSVLPLYRGMRLLLYDKTCARLLLMNGCVCILEDILMDSEEV